jgi:hypothetical protein
MPFLGDLVAFGAPWLTPLFGYGAVAGFLLLQGDSTWSDTWKIVISVLLGVFVSLCGVVYRDITRRLDLNDSAVLETNRVVNLKLDEMAKKQERMFGMIMLQAVFSSDGDKDKLIESIKAIIERE